MKTRTPNKIDPLSGRYIRLHERVEVMCPCNKRFVTSQDRVSIGRGKYCSKTCMYQYRVNRAGKFHPRWAGDNPKYSAIHKWMASTFGQELICEWCGKESTNPHEIHWANITGIYNRERANWARLCAKCHWNYDRGDRYAR